ncbi:MAG: choice-of-anchor D domain-containing protein [Candidatus Kapabacteria bacterium]|nr:choice-of-anchor D domain-containing protein [Candidatus Kapabacteria bacterium]MDW8011854.1 choice-of-anchor D domain-containing protein [Bacteroidota bacterium]
MARYGLTLLLGLSLWSSLLAQQPPKRYVLIEEFTSATCPPCVQASEKLNAMVRVDRGLISIRYHMNWPAPGDPFNVANPTENQARRQYYGVNSIPFAAVMGTWTGHPVTSAFDDAVRQQQSRPVRLQITVIESRQNAPNISVTVRIRNVGSQSLSLSGHVLHTAVVNRRVDLPDLPQRLQNSNGETVFYDAMMKMLPSASGTALSGSIAPGQEQSFGPFVYQLGTGELWPPGQDYVIAFVQNSSTREIIDAGTNLEEKLAYVTVQLTAPTPQFSYIPRSTTVTRTVTLRNTSSQAYSFRLVADPNRSVVLQNLGWSATISPDSVYLAPGASQQFTLRITSPSDAGYVRLELKPKLLTRTGGAILELQDTSVVVGLLSENSQYILYYGITPWFVTAYLNIASQIPALRGDVAFLPLLPEEMAAFPVQSFRLAVFPMGDYPLHTPGGELDHIFNAIRQALNAGTRVWLISQAGMYWAFDPQSQYRTSAARSFYTNDLGLQYTRLQQRFSGNTLVSFPIAGVANDPIGNGFSATANTSVNAGYNLYTDIFSLRSGSASQPVFYYDNTPSSLGGVRRELSNGNRIVYTSFGPEAIASASLRQDLWNRVVTWLLGGGGQQSQPRIALSTYSLRFDSVEINTTRSLTLSISNSGNAELRITQIQLSGADANAFNVPEADLVPIVLNPSEETTLEIQFRPTRTGSHTAQLTITCNDPTEPQAIVLLSGVGRQATSVAEVLPQALHISPIPATGVVRVRIPSNLTYPAEVELRDLQGRVQIRRSVGAEVGELVLPVYSLAAGTYTLTVRSGSQLFRSPVLIVR